MKIKFRTLLPVWVAIISVSVISCVNHNLETSNVPPVSCDTVRVVSFNNDIMPIITSSCALGTGTCHNGGNGAELDWRVFQNFQDHSAEVKRRITLPASDPDKMPRVGKLTFDQIQLMVCWVEQGSNDN